MLYMNELREIVNNLDSYLENIISRKATNIYGTTLYEINASHKLEDMVRNFNGQTLFFTASATDMQWHIYTSICQIPRNM